MESLIQIKAHGVPKSYTIDLEFLTHGPVQGRQRVSFHVDRCTEPERICLGAAQMGFGWDRATDSYLDIPKWLCGSMQVHWLQARVPYMMVPYSQPLRMQW
jgi:hypothetical protein